MSISDMIDRSNRRDFLASSTRGLSSIALAGLLHRDFGSSPAAAAPAAARPQDFRVLAPKAKRVIYLFQSGGPPQHDLFDHKPLLERVHGQEVPDSIFGGQRLTGMTAGQSSFPVAKSLFEFERFGQSGIELNRELLPHLGSVADEIALLRSMHTEAINHDPAITFFQTGSQLPGRPSMGSWLLYGLGQECDDLPGYVVLTSVGKGGQAQPIAARQWHSGFLPSRYQGVQFHSSGAPVLYLNRPAGVSVEQQRQLARLASHLVARFKLDDRPVRFDVIAVVFPPEAPAGAHPESTPQRIARGEPEIRHHEHAFESYL